MNRVNKVLLAKLITHFVEVATMKQTHFHLPDFLPNEGEPLKKTRHFEFLADYALWYQQNGDSQTPFEDILKMEDLSYWYVLTYLREQLLTFDADAPFEPPTIPQVAWVFERLYANSMHSGTFRSLIYGEMGFDESAYSPLYVAGGMTINNALYREYGDAPADDLHADLETEAGEDAYIADPRNTAINAFSILLKEWAFPLEEHIYWLSKFNQTYKEMTEERRREDYRNAQTPDAQAKISESLVRFNAWCDAQEKEPQEKEKTEGKTDAA